MRPLLWLILVAGCHRSLSSEELEALRTDATIACLERDGIRRQIENPPPSAPGHEPNYLPRLREATQRCDSLTTLLIHEEDR